MSMLTQGGRNTTMKMVVRGENNRTEVKNNRDPLDGTAGLCYIRCVSGQPSKLPYGTLASGSEGIKNAIKGFEDACVSCLLFS